MKTQNIKLRAAHVTMRDGRALVISGWRIFKVEANGARAVFASTRLESPKVKATIQGTRAVLEGKRAA